jgi:hypothetical protein
MRRRLAFAEKMLPELIKMLHAHRPDYLILDAAAHWGSVAAGVLRLPSVSYRLTFAVHRDMCDAEGIARRFYGRASREFTLQGMLDLVRYYDVAQRVDRL